MQKTLYLVFEQENGAFIDTVMSWNQVVTSTNQGWRKKELIRNVRQQPQAREIASDQVAIEYLSVVNNQQDYLHEKKCSLRVKCNLSYCRKEAWKKFRFRQDSNPWLQILRYFDIINLIDNVNWPPLRVSKMTFRALALRQSDSWRKMELRYHYWLIDYF